MKWWRLGYSSLLLMLIPYIVVHLLSRGRKQRGYWQHVGERFGFYRGVTGENTIWLHAVSVGETRAALPLIKALQTHYPDYQILLTHMTPTGRETGRALFGDSVLQCYLPYDFSFAVKAFLKHFKPAMGLLMETEIWFNIASSTAALSGLEVALPVSNSSAHSRLAKVAVVAAAASKCGVAALPIVLPLAPASACR